MSHQILEYWCLYFYDIIFIFFNAAAVKYQAMKVLSPQEPPSNTSFHILHRATEHPPALDYSADGPGS